MPMGLTNSPATFMQTMSNIFFNMLVSGIVVFLDDILMYWCKVKEKFTIVEKALVHLCQYMFYYKLKKSRLLCKNTMFFSFDFTPKGMCISDWMCELEWMDFAHYTKISTIIPRFCTVFIKFFTIFWCHFGTFSKVNMQEWVICID